MPKDSAAAEINEQSAVSVFAATHPDANPAPAWEEGPHLKDPELRALKRQQMREAGLTPDSDGISDDQRAILREKGD